MKKNRKWEVIQPAGPKDVLSERLWVYGGWIVRTRSSACISQVFVQDVDHVWKLGEEQ